MAHYDLKTEQLKEMAPKLRAGDTVTLTGTVYTARDAAHKKIVAAMDAGDKLPFDLDGAAIYYAGPTPAKPGQVIGSVGPTTSGRMDPFAPHLLDAGLACMIGKGVRGQGVQDAMERNGAVYMVAIGGAGAAILAGGRYNALCAKFGKDMPAGGFGIDVESVADSLAGQSRPEVATRRDTVRIALTKGRLEKKTLALLKAAGYDNYFVGTVEATPSLDDVIAAVKASGYKKVVLRPLMIVAGDHANNDMAGDEDGSWKTEFEKAGFEVTTVVEGLGSVQAIQDLFVAHAQAAIDSLK